MDDDNEDDLWNSFTRDIEALPKEQRLTEEQVRPVKKKQAAPTVLSSGQRQPVAQDKPDQSPGDGLDRKTSEKFRKGQMSIEATLDLHGMTQDEAHPALHKFIKRSYADKKRCVLVITGKGAEGNGILKRMTPEWLEDRSVKNLILKTATAQAKDGGSGALYILLRRQR